MNKKKKIYYFAGLILLLIICALAFTYKNSVPKTTTNSNLNQKTSLGISETPSVHPTVTHFVADSKITPAITKQPYKSNDTNTITPPARPLRPANKPEIPKKSDIQKKQWLFF